MSGASKLHAVVLGASMTGLLAARVLREGFDKVTLIERDVLDRSDLARKGVPQGKHAHALLVRGGEIITGLFPGLRDELMDRRCSTMHLGIEFAQFHFDVWKASLDTGLFGINVSRPLLEAAIRRRVMDLQGVDMRNGAKVIGLLMTNDQSAVTGARVIQDGVAEDIEADLVVDATGAASKTPEWLEALGHKRPRETRYRVNIGYATQNFRRPDPPPPWKGILVASTPPEKRGGIILPIEGDEWTVTLTGSHGDLPPTDKKGFLAYAKSFPHQELYNAIARAESLSEIRSFQFPENIRRHYDKVDPFPDRLVVMGDAACKFNPIYGQGMTVCALEAQLLQSWIQKHPPQPGQSLRPLTDGFRKGLAGIIDNPWNTVVFEDLRHRETQGFRPFGIGLMHWYLERLHRAAGLDARVAHGFYKVSNFVDPPSRLVTPAMIGRVLLRNAIGAPRPGTAPAGFREASPL